MRLLYLALAALLSTALAQESTTDSSTATSTSSQAFTTTIAVGRAGHTFSPDVVQVPVGGFVEFDFYPTNHSVIRAEYLNPCVPYEITGIGKVGFYSGFRPVDAILADPPKWTLQINDSDPIFFYCGAPGSCTTYQMVGVINPNASVSLDTHKQYAADADFALLPGEPWPDEHDPSVTTSTSTATAIYTTSMTATMSSTPTTSGSASGATATPESHAHQSTLSTGAIAGIAVGGAAVVLAAAALIFFCGRRSRRRARNEQPTAPTTPAMGPTHPPAYVPPATNYGYMSPTNKHLSMTTATPVTDAFGNPIHNGGGPYSGGGYPAATYPQGYAGQPPMQQSQSPHMMGVGNPRASYPQHSPSTDIFGTIQQQQQQQQHMHDTQSAAEVHSLRASSPSSMHASHAAPAPVVGGIEAFLQRQGRTSPQPESEVPGDQAFPHGGVGPYEMAATGTHLRQS
ncbi:hypothetical protein A1O7_04205 [Cladophialophora yegresii CBS 114405]|uniref:Phytocyanin domain-containing protein n=1 Tax=Cladophialophora yegresii CBS 114405 TaxID=1182544 RepID=W9W6A2_9EURO|nr:uncharacterized protein A1O7_04205 [Cladophialophora yegresii CBS 114405]EXJ60056.1 hypothetical protein A1O7_04205 [Cladophialophora yegresii CBS 114405]